MTAPGDPNDAAKGGAEGGAPRTTGHPFSARPASARGDHAERRSVALAGDRSWLPAVAAVGGVLALVAVLAVLLTGPLRNDDPVDQPVAQPAVAAVVVSEELPEAPEPQLRAAPALRIHPQRAVAGPPLELRVAGIGCPGASGVLSITEAGSATQAGGADRLVVRRRFDVAADRSFSATPTLVGQPPGSYRVSIECDRFRRAGALDDTAGRQIFELTEVLELTGPAAAREFSVSPVQAIPGLTTQFAFSGRGCNGADAAVQVRVFPPSAMAPGPLNVLTPPLANGAWQGLFTVNDVSAYGTYTFEASCTDSSGLQFAYVSRHVHFGELTLQPVLVTSTWDDLLDDLGIRPKPVASGIGAAVAGTPTYTG